MLRIIVIALIAVPFIEIWGLLKVGQWIGPWPTILAVVLTAVLGGFLTKQQGLQVLRLVQLQLRRGELPGSAIIDGVCILAGGVLLMTPGFFTDALGFLLLLPFTRGIVKIWLKKGFLTMIRDGKTIIIRRF